MVYYITDGRVDYMGTKELLLSLLENSRGDYISGEEIANRLSVSRTAVWKAVGALRGEGYPIDAVQNKGYRLSEKTDILSEQGIRKYLNPICADLDIRVLPTVDSTNRVAREQAAGGAPEGYTVLANTQTNGKGRRGRSFYSPADTGVYMSILLRPECCPQPQAIRLTTMTAVAVCEAIEALSGEKAEIKWVNDIYVKGRKVCGILTEASFGLEDGFLEYAVLGVGVNVTAPKDGFPDDLQSIAGSVFGETQNDGRNHLAAEMMNRFMTYYQAPRKDGYREHYRSRSMVLGRDIEIITADTRKTAAAVDIDEECRLIVRYPDGTYDRISSGEVQMRLS